MAENKLADLSTEFAVQILKLTDGIKGHYSLANQLDLNCLRGFSEQYRKLGFWGNPI